MLDASLKDQLQTILTQKVTEDVVLASSLDDSKKSAEMAELLDEIAELSDRVTPNDVTTMTNVARPLRSNAQVQTSQSALRVCHWDTSSVHWFWRWHRLAVTPSRNLTKPLQQSRVWTKT